MNIILETRLHIYETYDNGYITEEEKNILLSMINDVVCEAPEDDYADEILTYVKKKMNRESVRNYERNTFKDNMLKDSKTDYNRPLKLQLDKLYDKLDTLNSKKKDNNLWINSSKNKDYYKFMVNRYIDRNKEIDDQISSITKEINSLKSKLK